MPLRALKNGATGSALDGAQISFQDVKFYHVPRRIRSHLWSNILVFAVTYCSAHYVTAHPINQTLLQGTLVFLRPLSSSRVALAGLLGIAAGGVFAQTVKDAYVQDQRGVIVRNSNFGDAKIGNLCWRTGLWTPALAIAECDPDIAPRQAPAPKPAAAPVPANNPAPVATPKVIQPAPRKCDFTGTLDADATFEFDQSQLRPQARAKLDAIAARAAGCVASPLVKVTGHTDRLGSAAYNQKLSEARAQAVTAYLKSKQVPVAQTAGAGKNEPVKACDAKLARAALIECLAPNRRVVVDVQGRAR